MEDLYPIFILMVFTGVIFYLGQRFERYLINARDPYINSTNAELRRREATRKARNTELRRKIRSWKDIP